MESANKIYSPAERSRLFRKVEGSRYSVAIIKILKEKGVSSNSGYLRWAYHTKNGDNLIYEALEEFIRQKALLSKRSNKRTKKAASTALI